MYHYEHVNGSRHLFDAHNNTTGLCVAAFMAVACEVNSPPYEKPIVLRRMSCKAIFVDYANIRPLPVY